MYTDVARLEAPIEVHLAQAMCYGYFYRCDKDLDGIRLQLPPAIWRRRDPAVSDRPLKGRTGTVVFGRGP